MITIEHKRGTLTFESLQPGDLFMLDGGLYMKIVPPQTASLHALTLESAQSQEIMSLRHVGSLVQVVPVSGTLIVNHTEDE